MKVCFLDFDGVLNSAASFRMEHRRGTERIADTLCAVACSNFQHILDEVPDCKIVISSTWRKLHDLNYLKDKLAEYLIDSSRVIGITPSIYNGYRTTEIKMWLDEHPEVTHYVILDDSDDVCAHIGHVVLTTWQDGLLSTHVTAAIACLKPAKTT
jgi:hypothetical protein